MANSTLGAIRTKVRRLTRSPSTQQVSDADINEYINTFVLYDFPSHLRLFNLRKTFNFYTEPNVDQYSTTSLDPTNPLFNFKNAIITSHTPVYVSGYRTWFSQGREDFFGKWPMVYQSRQIATGDGLTTAFAGTLSSKPVLPNELLFTSIDADGKATGLKARPLVDPINGVQTQSGNLYNTLGPIPSERPTVPTPANLINFSTGVYNIDFFVAPAAGKPIYVQSVPYSAARPTSVLYFDNTFTLRPVPDQQYEVRIEAYVRPTEFFQDADEPELEQWWQYIAVGAAIKLLQDRTDFETAQMLMPMMKEQERLVLRTTLVQQGDDRAATIYSEQTSLAGGPWGWFQGGGF